jgi:hypothetical protein
MALTATSWAPKLKSRPEGPTRLDREIRVGVPARRADGSRRRTAGRWVGQPAVAAVRFKRPSGRRTRLSRARLGKAARVPRGADDPQGPNRPGAGGFARRPPGRGSWGLSFSSSGHPHRAPTPGSATYQGGTRPTASAVPVPAGHRSYSSGATQSRGSGHPASQKACSWRRLVRKARWQAARRAAGSPSAARSSRAAHQAARAAKCGSA